MNIPLDDLENLQKENEMLRLILENTNDWEFLISPDGNFLFISDSVKDLSGYHKNDFINNPDFIYTLIYKEDIQAFKNYMHEAQNLSGKGKSFHFRFFTRTKHIKWGEIKMKALFNLRGEYLGLRGSIHDITALKEALGKIQNITQASQYETGHKEKFMKLAEQRDRELTTSLMKMSQKNELLTHIKKQLENTRADQPELQKKLKDIISRIKNEASGQGQWDEFRVYFEKSHPGFFQRLTERFPLLTTKDMKLCAYLRLHLNTKEISNLLNISPKSAEVSRVRLRRKLGLNNGENLAVYLSRL